LRWAKASQLAVPVRDAAAPVPTFTLAGAEGKGKLVLRAGSQAVQWNGMELRLGFAPQIIDGQPFIHRLDLQKTLQPLLLGVAADRNPNPVIVIDPGHGGEDPGTSSVLGNYFEKTYTLDWALRLQAILVTNGLQVWLTRTCDQDLALSNRVAFAVERKANLFVSLHFNSASPNRTEQGIETYCLTPMGMPSSLTRGYADEIAVSFPNNAFDAQNLQAAMRVHRALLQASGARDRGVRRARFPGVLRNQQCPAILVEGGYLSHPQEARLIHSPAHRQKLAEAVARAVLETVELPDAPPATETVSLLPVKASVSTGGVTAEGTSSNSPPNQSSSSSPSPAPKPESPTVTSSSTR
jgi:N-acetylmuramoyl-L-alanine amidase